MSILIVDDEAAILDELEEALVDEGHAVVKASSVDEAINRLTADSAIKVIITDLNMPGATGDELIHYATFYDKYHMIVMSGHCESLKAFKIIDDYKIPFFLKPIDVDELLDKVEELLG